MERCRCDRIPQPIRFAVRKVADLSLYKHHLYIGQTPSVRATNANLSIVTLRSRNPNRSWEPLRKPCHLYWNDRKAVSWTMGLRVAIRNLWASNTKESSQKRGKKLQKKNTVFFFLAISMMRRIKSVNKLLAKHMGFLYPPVIRKIADFNWRNAIIAKTFG